MLVVDPCKGLVDFVDLGKVLIEGVGITGFDYLL